MSGGQCSRGHCLRHCFTSGWKSQRSRGRAIPTKLKELQVGQARQPPSGWLEGDAHQLSAVEFEAVAVGVIDSAVPADDSRGGARQVPPQVVRRQKPKPSRARR